MLVYQRVYLLDVVSMDESRYWRLKKMFSNIALSDAAGPHWHISLLRFCWKVCNYPICSMYGIFTYILVIFRVTVGKYSIHGAYVYYSDDLKTSLPSLCFGTVDGCDLLDIKDCSWLRSTAWLPRSCVTRLIINRGMSPRKPKLPFIISGAWKIDVPPLQIEKWRIVDAQYFWGLVILRAIWPPINNVIKH